MSTNAQAKSPETNKEILLNSMAPALKSIKPFIVTTNNKKPDRGQCFKVLIAEDSLPERARLVAILQKQGYATIEANNGKDALEALKSEQIDLVLSDWRMPLMDGFSLCKHIKQDDSLDPYFILLTGQDSMCDLVAAMDAGADDYLSKPFDSEELRVRIQSGKRLMQMKKLLANKNNVLKTTIARESQLNKELQKDIIAAERLQRNMLPDHSKIINDVACAHFFRGACGVAGDCFSLLPLGENHVAFYHIDVVGHGVRAAMMSFAITRYLHEKSKYPPTSKKDVAMQDPIKVLEALNKEFQCNETCSDYFTIVYGVMDTRNGSACIAQAGHPHPMHVQQNGIVNKLGGGGLPIGLFSSTQYEKNNFNLLQGQRLVLYSDGILECKVKGGRQFNENMLKQVLYSLKDLSIEQLQIKLEQFIEQLIGTESINDDISILIIERTNKDLIQE
jgi:phosphoserine phosphatase RsbU/P